MRISDWSSDVCSSDLTGAWARFTGWDVRCMEVFEGRLLFGSPNGGVFLANETGSDDGQPYTGAAIPLFDDFGAPGARKVPKVEIGRASCRERVCKYV